MGNENVLLCQSCVVFHERLFQFTDQDGQTGCEHELRSFVVITFIWSSVAMNSNSKNSCKIQFCWLSPCNHSWTVLVTVRGMNKKEAGLDWLEYWENKNLDLLMHLRFKSNSDVSDCTLAVTMFLEFMSGLCAEYHWYDEKKGDEDIMVLITREWLCTDYDNVPWVHWWSLHWMTWSKGSENEIWKWKLAQIWENENLVPWVQA